MVCVCLCAGSTDVIVKQCITVGCLYKLLAWARVKQQSPSFDTVVHNYKYSFYRQWT